jgi:hypothetical protein
MEGPIDMARLAWVASELGYATGFPKKSIIPQKPQPDEARVLVAMASQVSNLMIESATNHRVRWAIYPS